MKIFNKTNRPIRLSPPHGSSESHNEVPRSTRVWPTMPSPDPLGHPLFDVLARIQAPELDPAQPALMASGGNFAPAGAFWAVQELADGARLDARHRTRFGVGLAAQRAHLPGDGVTVLPRPVPRSGRPTACFDGSIPGRPGHPGFCARCRTGRSPRRACSCACRPNRPDSGPRGRRGH